jgi:hypothetical protein
LGMGCSGVFCYRPGFWVWDVLGWPDIGRVVCCMLRCGAMACCQQGCLGLECSGFACCRLGCVGLSCCGLSLTASS